MRRPRGHLEQAMQADNEKASGSHILCIHANRSGSLSLFSGKNCDIMPQFLLLLHPAKLSKLDIGEWNHPIPYQG